MVTYKCIYIANRILCNKNELRIVHIFTEIMWVSDFSLSRMRRNGQIKIVLIINKLSLNQILEVVLQKENELPRSMTRL